MATRSDYATVLALLNCKTNIVESWFLQTSQMPELLATVLNRVHKLSPAFQATNYI